MYSVIAVVKEIAIGLRNKHSGRAALRVNFWWTFESTPMITY